MTTQHQTVATFSTEYKICLRFNPIVSVRVFGFAVINEVDCETFEDIEANLAEEDAIEVPAVTEAGKTWFLKYNVRELISSVKGLIGDTESGIFLVSYLRIYPSQRHSCFKNCKCHCISSTAKCVSLEQVTTALCQLAMTLDDLALDVPSRINTLESSMELLWVPTISLTLKNYMKFFTEANLQQPSQLLRPF
ncbi:hypothetical protein BCR33DRAFT_781131 [Rhizoclosmatium globosum]|uniref:Uncharacterized protein n=1 Tax=Rhizoclosmatium globosum TaxID=329046 RepID=A0A1Y2CTL3_9FUNG|nr:hypothetical protein BCR33DRAFT_781131 [Rhizoclosmatium globosum]|eukprot:ORY50398.1 hypothetical protein BCR33DRAFT_781131 [Rhizoclosmatium globosum]